MALLTPVHRRIGLAILGFERRGEPAFGPSLVYELGYAAESSLTATLRIMQRNGILLIQGGGEKGRSRVATLTSKGRFALGGGGIPLVGSISAGPLSEALAQPEDVLEPRDLLPYRDGDFLLRVRGDSMIGDGILNGDSVLLRPNVVVRQGEIAAVLVGEAHEATLKRVFFSPKKSRITLRASNPQYPDVVVNADELKVAGVFRGLIRHANIGT
jgi:repressor LexA